jgi:DNA-binding CsgD family transcriptional regulator
MKKQTLLEKVLALKTANMTSIEIAEALDASPQTISALLCKHELPYKKIKAGTRRGYKPHPKEERVLQLVKQGLSHTVIYQRIKVSPQVIKKIIEKNK